MEHLKKFKLDDALRRIATLEKQLNDQLALNEHLQTQLTALQKKVKTVINMTKTFLMMPSSLRSMSNIRKEKGPSASLKPKKYFKNNSKQKKKS